MKKYFYKLNSYYPYDGLSDSIILIHDKQFSKDEIDNMIIESVLEKMLNNRDKGIFNIDHYSEGDYLEDDKKLKEKLKEMKKECPDDWDNITFEEYKKEYAIRWWTTFDIEKDFYQIMKDLFGFEELKFEDELSIDNSMKIVNPDEDYKEEDDREYNILKKIRDKYWEDKK